MKLAYKAIAEDGKILKGTIEAVDSEQVALYLRQHHLHPVNITSVREKTLENFLIRFRKPTHTDLIFFTRQLGSMLTSGLTLIQAFVILKNQMSKRSMMEVVGGIMSVIEEGGKLSTGISKYPAFFSPVYIALIKAAESSGILDKTLTRLSDNLEKEQKLNSTIRGALLYPAIIVLLMVGVFIIMTVVVIPQLASLYSNLNYPLPATMQIAMGISQSMTTFWPILIITIVFLVYLFRKWHKTVSGKHIVDMFILKLPVFGRLTSESILVEFTRTFGLLIGTGTPIFEALTQSSDVVGNVNYKAAISTLAKRVEKGVTVGDAMSSSPLFPPILVEMVKIGEQTGKVDESLLKVSEYFEREVDERVKTITTALEPFIIIILSIGVGFLIYMVITPIYKLITSIQ